MKINLITLLLLTLLCLISKNSSADAMSLQSLRFFYTPEQRNPEPIIPRVTVNQRILTTMKSPGAPKRTRTIDYIGEIRSDLKRRVFWKQGSGRYLSTVLGKEKRRGKDENAKRKEASHPQKGKEAG